MTHDYIKDENFTEIYQIEIKSPTREKRMEKSLDTYGVMDGVTSKASINLIKFRGL